MANTHADTGQPDTQSGSQSGNQSVVSPASRAWVNGELVPADQAVVPAMSAAVFRGTSVFDVMSVTMVGDTLQAVGLVPHFERMLASADEMGLVSRGGSALGVAELRDAIVTVLTSWVGPAIVRTVIADAAFSRAGHLSDPVSGDPVLGDPVLGDPASGDGLPDDVVVAMTANPAPARPSQPLRMESAAAKIDPAVLPPSIKVAATYAPGLRRERALGADVDGIINFTPDGHLLEAVSASVGVFVGGVMCLPPLDQVLDSITRRLVVDAADALGIEVRVETIPAQMVHGADQLFLASSTRFVAEIGQLDDTVYRLASDGSTARSGTDDLVGVLKSTVDDIVEGRHALSQRWLTPVGSSR